MKIRPAGGKDLDSCLGLIRVMPNHFTKNAIEQIAKDLQGQVAFVAEDSKVRGFIVLKQVNPQVLEIVWLAVEKERQGQGIGSKMIEHTSDYMVDKDIHLLKVKTMAPVKEGDTYIATRKFYEKNGFSLIEVIDPYPGWEAGSPCAIYVRSL